MLELQIAGLALSLVGSLLLGLYIFGFRAQKWSYRLQNWIIDYSRFLVMVREFAEISETAASSDLNYRITKNPLNWLFQTYLMGTDVGIRLMLVKLFRPAVFYWDPKSGGHPRVKAATRFGYLSSFPVVWDWRKLTIDLTLLSIASSLVFLLVWYLSPELANEYTYTLDPFFGAFVFTARGIYGCILQVTVIVVAAAVLVKITDHLRRKQFIMKTAQHGKVSNSSQMRILRIWHPVLTYVSFAAVAEETHSGKVTRRVIGDSVNIKYPTEVYYWIMQWVAWVGLTVAGLLYTLIHIGRALVFFLLVSVPLATVQIAQWLKADLLGVCGIILLVAGFGLQIWALALG